METMEIDEINSSCPLTVDERLTLIDVIDELQLVSTSTQFAACMDGAMQQIFPHGGIGCGIGNIAEKNVKPYRMLLHHFPRAYIESLRQPDGGLNSPLMSRWRSTRAPVLVDLQNSLIGWSLSWLFNIRKFDFRNIAVHGLIDVGGVTTSYFCFIRMPHRLGPKHTYLLNKLVPHLHIALVRAMTTMEDMTEKASPVILTPRQKEVLHWLHQGKTNWEISKIIGKSEDTVKYHVAQIFSKLNSANRTQAVAQAVALNILEI